MAFLLLTFGAHAQSFPSPYCDIEDTSVEEITSISFGGMNIENTNSTDILIDETATIANVVPGETYTIVVKGATYGDFDNSIVAYIDWNQNFTLNDVDEVFAVGIITDSDGYDDVFVTLDITIPADALSGNTRIRITKTYTDEDSIAEVNPCAIEMDAFGMGAFPGFGQAIDFTLNVETLGVNAFDINALSIYPIPIKDVLNIDYKSELSGVKIYNLLGQEIYTQSTASLALQLDVSSLTAGVYIVKLFTEETQHSFRVLKQ